MLTGQMSPWRLGCVKDGPRNLRLKFGQNRVSNSWDMTDIEFLWWSGVGIYSHFHVQPPTIVGLRLSCSWVGAVTKMEFKNVHGKHCWHVSLVVVLSTTYIAWVLWFLGGELLQCQNLLVQRHTQGSKFNHVVTLPPLHPSSNTNVTVKCPLFIYIQEETDM